MNLLGSTLKIQHLIWKSDNAPHNCLILMKIICYGGVEDSYNILKGCMSKRSQWGSNIVDEVAKNNINLLTRFGRLTIKSNPLVW